MKRLLIAAILCLAFSFTAYAQESDPTPASREDIQTYFEVVHSHDQMKRTMEAMLGPMHQMVHGQFLKMRDKVPADFEERMNKIMDDMLKNMPMDEISQAMIPAYQKHFTKGDINVMLAFYSSPTGQKLLRELPAIAAEGMSSAMPIMQRHIDEMQDKIQKEIDGMMQESEKASEPAKK